MKEPYFAIVVLLLIVGTGIVIRFDGAAEPIWLDECHTAWTVDTDSLQTVTGRAADGNQPPFYFVWVWVATQAFGLSEFSLRVVSLISGIGLLVAAPWFAKTMTGRWSAAALVAALIAFDGQFIFYAGEARSYAMIQLLGLLQGFVFWRMLPCRSSDLKVTKWLFVWTLLSVILLYSHYTSLWIIAAESLVMIIVWVWSRRFPKKFLIALLAVALSLIPLFWNVSMVFERRSNWGPVSSLNQWWIDVEPWLVYWLLLPAGFAIAGWLMRIANPEMFLVSNSDSESEIPNWLLNTWLLLWAVSGPLSIAIVDALQIAPMSLLRYSAVCWVAMALFAGNCLKHFPPKLSWVAAAAIFGSSLFGSWWAQELVALRQLPTFRSEDWVTTVSQLSNSTEPVFQLADVIEDIDSISETDPRFQQYLQFPIRGAEAIYGSDLFTDGRQLFVIPTWNIQFTKEHLAAIRDAGGCWLVVRGEFDYALLVPGELERYLDDPIEFKVIPNESMPFAEVHLIRVRFEPAEAHEK